MRKVKKNISLKQLKKNKLTKLEFKKKYHKKPFLFFSKHFFKSIPEIKSLNYRFMKLPNYCLDYNFGYILIITKKLV